MIRNLILLATVTITLLFIFFDKQILALLTAAGYLTYQFVRRYLEFRDVEYKLTPYERSTFRKQLSLFGVAIILGISTSGVLIYENRFQQHDRTPAIQATQETIEKVEEWSKLDVPEEVER